MGCQSIIMAGLDSSSFYSYLLFFFFFQIFLCLVLDWPFFSVLQLLFPFLDSLFFFTLVDFIAFN